MNELLFWLLMPYVLTLGFVVGFCAYRPPQRGRYRDLNELERMETL